MSGFFDKFEEICLVVLLVAMSVLLMVQILFRFFTGDSLTFAGEYVRVMFVYSAFLGLPYAIKKDLMVKTDFFKRKLPYFLRDIADILSTAIMFFLFFVFFLASLELVKYSYEQDLKLQASGFPVYIMQFACLLSFFLSVVRIIQKVLSKKEEKC